MRQWLNIVLTLTLVIALSACSKTQPQQPIRHNRQEHKTDDNVLALIELNQRMAQEADRQLMHYAKAGYVQMENGCWIKGLTHNKQPLKEGETVQAHIRTYLLDNTLVEDRHTSLTCGKEQEIEAVADILSEMQHLTAVSIIAPWYKAYGTTGSTDIPPYTNIRVELQITE
ncbi:MAG: FKBP-type peptidyl-prolyl cis-trans isomerase [Paludibacteraceae bacterium]|nr:FKBP-type peptidyl-prolyl cis-trans isomerase [Paludibacteraceae bacterium]